MRPHFIDISRIYDRRGSLSFVQNGDICFDIRRIYWLYDMPSDGERYGRALRNSYEIIIAVSGSFDVHLDDGHGDICTFTLKRPWEGLVVPPMTWRVIDNISGGSRALVLSSELYDANEYIRERSIFDFASSSTPKKFNVGQSHIVKRETLCSKRHGECTIDDASVLHLVQHTSHMGSLTVLENKDPIPFDAQRVFYIYDVPTDAARGGHSHYRMQELIVALCGSFDVEVRDGKSSKTITLSRPYEALYVPCGLWRSLQNFSSGAVCLAFASELYEAEDYVRSFDEFCKLANVNNEAL